MAITWSQTSRVKVFHSSSLLAAIKILCICICTTYLKSVSVSGAQGADTKPTRVRGQNSKMPLSIKQTRYERCELFEISSNSRTAPDSDMEQELLSSVVSESQQSLHPCQTTANKLRQIMKFLLGCVVFLTVALGSAIVFLYIFYYLS